MNKTIPLLILPFFSTGVIAGIFGPDNYEECVLEKMEGQAKALIPIAKKACEKKFPYEKSLGDYEGLYDYTWGAKGEKAAIVIRNNIGKYKITKLEVTFSNDACSQSSVQTNFLTKTLVVEDGVKSVFEDRNADGFRCAVINNVWGILKI